MKSIKFACSNGTPVAHNVPKCKGGFWAYPFTYIPRTPLKNKWLGARGRSPDTPEKQKRMSGDVRAHCRDDMCHLGGSGCTYSRRYHDATNLTCACHRRPPAQETPALVYTQGQTITHLFFSHPLLIMMSLAPAGLLVTAHCCCGTGRGERGGV